MSDCIHRDDRTCTLGFGGSRAEPSRGYCLANHCGKYVPITIDGSTPPRPARKPKESKPLTWPSILRDDPQHQPFIRICESCPNFSVRKDGCPACKLFKGCAKLGKFGQAIIKREWPEGCPQRAV